MIHYINDDKELKSECLIEMANQVWPGAYDVRRMQDAIDRTIKHSDFSSLSSLI